MKFWPEGISEAARADIAKAKQTRRRNLSCEVRRARRPGSPDDSTGRRDGRGDDRRQGCLPAGADDGRAEGAIWQNVAHTPPRSMTPRRTFGSTPTSSPPSRKSTKAPLVSSTPHVREVYELRIRGGDPANIGTTSAPATSSTGAITRCRTPAYTVRMPVPDPEMMGQAPLEVQHRQGRLQPRRRVRSRRRRQRRTRYETSTRHVRGRPAGRCPERTDRSHADQTLHPRNSAIQDRGFYMKVAIDHRRLPDFSPV